MDSRADADLNSGHFPPGGHVAALYQDELYQVVTGPAGYARLQAFGVIFGCERVVIYVEPDNGKTQDVTSNTARTHLLINNEPLNWAEHAAEFRENMPDELDAFQNEIGQNAQHSDHRLAIRERLKAIKELFKFGRYRPAKAGKFSVGEPAENTGGTADEDAAKQTESRPAAAQRVVSAATSTRFSQKRAVNLPTWSRAQSSLNALGLASRTVRVPPVILRTGQRGT